MKKFLLTILTGALVATSFTSCIENEIPAEVTAIYNGQADLLAARAALLAADANYVNAQAAHENAIAASEAAKAEGINIANDYASANNSLLLAAAQVRLEALVAQNALLVEQAKIALELALVQFQLDMKKLEQLIVDADNALISKYFNLYRGSSTTLNSLLTNELSKEQEIVVQLVANALAVTSDENALAALANDIAEDIAKKDIILAELVELNAIIADGTDLAAIQARREGLEADLAEIDSALGAQQIAIVEKRQEKNNAKDVYYELLGANGVLELEFKYTNAKAYLDFLLVVKAGYVANNEANAANIAEWQAILDDYEGILAQLTTDLEEADTALGLAQIALDEARMAYNDSLDVQTEENDILGQLIIDEDRVANKLRQAATALQDLLDNAGTTSGDVTTATNDQTDAQAAFDIARDNFNDQTLPFTVKPGADGMTGIISDNTEPNTTRTYLVIATITEGPAGTYTGTYAAGVATMPGSGTPRTLPLTAAAVIGDYIEVEADNTQTNDLQQFKRKTRALDDANDALEAAILADEMYEADLEAAQELYDEKLDLFENAVALLEAQQIISDDADDAVDAALEARGLARMARDGAKDALADAKKALRKFNRTTAAELADWIEAAEVNTAQNLVSIDLTMNDIAVLEAEIADIIAQLDAANGDEILAQEAILDLLYAQLDDLKTERDVLIFSSQQKNRLLNVINNTLGGDYDLVMQEIASAEKKVERIEARILATQYDIDNFVNSDAAGLASLASLELQLEQIQGDIAVYRDIVAKYKALLDSVL